LIFIKLRWLPWNITSQVIVAVIPIVGLTVLVLTLNVVAPSSSKLRVYRYTVPIVSQVRGRVLEVPIEEGNRLVKKGEVLFRIDPTPYQLEANSLNAQLATAQASQRELLESQKGANAKTVEARATIAEATSKIAEVRAQLETAKWNLAETVTRSPCDCYVINLQLRPGGFVAGLPLNPVMSLVEADGQVIAFYAQNELVRVQAGDEAEFALETYPGRII